MTSEKSGQDHRGLAAHARRLARTFTVDDDRQRLLQYAVELDQLADADDPATMSVSASVSTSLSTPAVSEAAPPAGPPIVHQQQQAQQQQGNASADGETPPTDTDGRTT